MLFSTSKIVYIIHQRFCSTKVRRRVLKSYKKSISKKKEEREKKQILCVHFSFFVSVEKNKTLNIKIINYFPVNIIEKLDIIDNIGNILS